MVVIVQRCTLVCLCLSFLVVIVPHFYSSFLPNSTSLKRVIFSHCQKRYILGVLSVQCFFGLDLLLSPPGSSATFSLHRPTFSPWADSLFPNTFGVTNLICIAQIEKIAHLQLDLYRGIRKTSWNYRKSQVVA